MRNIFFNLSLIFPTIAIIYGDTILDGHSSQRKNSGNETNHIPKLIHQTYRTLRIPSRWKYTWYSVQMENPDYEYIFWTDEDIEGFLEDHYSWFLPTYHGYKYNIQRVDAFRYFALYHYGGIYMDLDIGCRESLDPILKYAAAFPATEPIGLSNDFMACQPRHPFFRFLMESLVASDHSYLLPSLTIMLSTGPLFVTRQYYNAPLEITKDIRILGTEIYNHQLLFHVKGDSWHQWDARLLSSLWYNRTYWVNGTVFVLAIAALLYMYLG